jgi:hypothetical protein
MKGKNTRAGSGARAKGKTDFRRLREMHDEEIDYSDIPKLDQSFWKKAKLTMPEPRDHLTIRVGTTILWKTSRTRVAVRGPASMPFCAPTGRRDPMKARIAGHIGGVPAHHELSGRYVSTSQLASE